MAIDNRYIKGADVHRNRLRRMRAQYMNDPIIRALYDAGEAVRKDAQDSIIDGAVSGPGHVPSAPGTPPNADTHNLDKSIDVRMNKGRKTVTVVARAHYAAAQEFGTSRLPERPFMRPALQRNRNRAVLGAANAVRSVVRVYKWSPIGGLIARARQAVGLA